MFDNSVIKEDSKLQGISSKRPKFNKSEPMGTNPNQPIFSEVPETNENKPIVNNDVIVDLKKEENVKSSAKDTLENLQKESEYSRKITETRTKTLIIIVMSFIIIIPFFDEEWKNSDFRSYNSLIYYFDDFYQMNQTSGIEQTKHFVERNLNNRLFPIINITILEQIVYINQSLINASFRISELAYDQNDEGFSLITYSIKTQSTYIGYVGIVRSLMLIGIILLFFLFFENDIKTLVVEPLEIMVEIVDRVAKDPINAKNVKELENGIKNMAMKLKNKDKNGKNQDEEEIYEIMIIKSSIIKISALLATGLGEAGCEIIKHNLNNNQEVKHIIKGKRVYGIFGFCDIRNFTEINEILEEKAIVLVNEVAEIVHSNVHLYGGIVNKNIGENFLVLWKIDEKDVQIDLEGNMIFDNESEGIRFLTDQALIAFLNIIIQINNSPNILKYKYNKEINKRIQNFKVKMGFGLQLGWAIEGTIGSSYKIDASYLSPFVNMAARLDAATKQYGVSILFTEDIFDLLSQELKDICRLIDRVMVKGSLKPLVLYTVDVNLNLTAKKSNKIYLTKKEAKKAFQKRKEKLQVGIKIEGSIGKFILTKNSFRELLNVARSNLFNNIFNEGLTAYFVGNWVKSSELLNNALKLLKNDTDGPTMTILNYITENNLIAPPNWKSCRALTSK